VAVEVSLEGRTALVTGGGTGIGYGIAKRLLDAGATVTICGRRADVLDSAADALRAAVSRAEVRTIAADVTDEEQVAAAVAHACNDGRLDIAIANAGSAMPGPLLSQSPDGWRFTLDINVVAPAMTIKHAALAMREGGGAIVTISSQSAVRTAKWMAPYTVSKAAMDTLVRCAALELAPFRIRVNGIRPGLVPNQAIVMDEEPYLTAISRSLLGAPGTAEQLGDSVLYLTSDLSEWVTGQVYNVCGGLSVSDYDDFGDLARMVVGDDAFTAAQGPAQGPDSGGAPS
jgi:NAD(P)-dependent dehydrogenase (short-subunit alcohol dehydrogenase family)